MKKNESMILVFTHKEDMGIYHTYSFNDKWFIKMNESMILVFYS